MGKAPTGCRRWSLESQTPYVGRWLDDYREYRRGLLRHPGAVCEQPARYLEAMRLIDAEHDVLDLEEKAQAPQPGRR